MKNTASVCGGGVWLESTGGEVWIFWIFAMEVRTSECLSDPMLQQIKALSSVNCEGEETPSFMEKTRAIERQLAYDVTLTQTN